MSSTVSEVFIDTNVFGHAGSTPRESLIFLGGRASPGLVDQGPG